jgi:hypothetical protein
MFECSREGWTRKRLQRKLKYDIISRWIQLTGRVVRDDVETYENTVYTRKANTIALISCDLCVTGQVNLQASKSEDSSQTDFVCHPRFSPRIIGHGRPRIIKSMITLNIWFTIKNKSPSKQWASILLSQ